MEEDTLCYFSEVGVNNFFYPTERKGFIKNSSEYELLPWLSTNKALQPIKIKNKYIVDLTYDEKCNMINNIEQYTVVWIKK